MKPVRWYTFIDGPILEDKVGRSLPELGVLDNDKEREAESKP